MNESKPSGNLTKGDIISFVALLLMGVLVFFGMNFMTLGDRIPSLVVAILTVVLMTVFVFLAAYAKAQERDRSTWRIVQYALLTLYLIGLIPCYIFTAKFFDVQVDKEKIMSEVHSDIDGLNRLFSDYSSKCEQRASAYQIDLEAMLTTPEGKARIAELIGSDDPSEISQESVNQAVSSFSKMLKGSEYTYLVNQKNSLVKNCEKNFDNWNMLDIPKYALELGSARDEFAVKLEEIYSKAHNNFETEVPEFDTESDTDEGTIVDTFKSVGSFSLFGLLAVLFLGIMGSVSYILGKKSDNISMQYKDPSAINEDQGFDTHNF